jgi:hypothetical protein
MPSFQPVGDQPLAERVKVQLICMFDGKTCHRTLVGAAQVIRPGSPVAAGSFTQAMRMNGLETAMLLEGFAAGCAKCRETGL